MKQFVLGMTLTFNARTEREALKTVKDVFKNLPPGVALEVLKVVRNDSGRASLETVRYFGRS